VLLKRLGPPQYAARIRRNFASTSTKIPENKFQDKGNQDFRFLRNASRSSQPTPRRASTTTTNTNTPGLASRRLRCDRIADEGIVMPARGVFWRAWSFGPHFRVQVLPMGFLYLFVVFSFVCLCFLQIFGFFVVSFRGYFTRSRGASANLRGTEGVTPLIR
jgi:hypothetical protein